MVCQGKHLCLYFGVGSSLQPDYARICGVCGGGCAESSLIMIGDSCTINKRSEATVSPDCGEVPGIRTFGDKRRKF